MNYQTEIEAGIQSLFAAINEGFRGDAGVGQNHLHNWISALQNANNPALHPVSQELEALSQAIGRGDAAGMAKSFFLLGNLTSASALGIHSFEGLGDKLREISQKLTAAGGNMQIIAKHQGHSTVLAH